jgi:hypothetical protein
MSYNLLVYVNKSIEMLNIAISNEIYNIIINLFIEIITKLGDMPVLHIGWSYYLKIWLMQVVFWFV